jgi:tyrosinase
MPSQLLTVLAAALAILPTMFAAPAPKPWVPSTHFPVVDQWLNDKCPGKYQHGCDESNTRIRKDFQSMAPQERKAYTNAIKCLMTKPSQLDQSLYPAATNRYMDYAVIHVNRTREVHLSGFFLTWHRYFLWLFEQDLESQCGYTGSFPYWNWPATANNLHGSAIFDGSEYSMSGDGLYIDSGPVVLSPSLQLPHGSGGGCVTTGPFANMEVTMAVIPTTFVINGLDLPPTAFQKNVSCLTRDLNTYAAQTYTNYDLLYSALAAPNISDFSNQINGILGGGSLGLHSGAHFVVGSPASSLYVSPMDPVWYPLHTMLDNLYTSWQLRHPEIATSLYGTNTALNLPPSDATTLETREPDWGYLGYEHDGDGVNVGELMSTTGGPFCYRYDVAL